MIIIDKLPIEIQDNIYILANKLGFNNVLDELERNVRHNIEIFDGQLYSLLEVYNLRMRVHYGFEENRFFSSSEKPHLLKFVVFKNDSINNRVLTEFSYITQ